jgi:class 3 adenylate cyclase
MTDLILNEAELEAGLTSLESSASWSPRVVSKLESLIRDGSDFDLFRVNPLRYATERGVEESEAIDLFLHAAKSGLFVMEWAIVCVSCANVFKSFRNLEKLDPHFQCNACQMKNSANLDEYIQVMFTVSPKVRDILLHHPERLTAESRYFEYQLSKDAKAQIDGNSIPQVLKSWTLLLEYLDPGETTSLNADLESGALVFRDVITSSSVAFLVIDGTPPGKSSFLLSLSEDGFDDPEAGFSPLTLETPIGDIDFPTVHFIGPNSISVQVENTTNRTVSLWAVRYPPLDSFTPQKIEFDPFLSAKRTLSTQTFRQLFRSELVSKEEALTVNDLTFLFTDLKGSTSMYDEIGDATAYNLVRLHFDVLARAVAENSGAIVKTIGDAVMATFIDPTDAVKASLAMFEELEQLNDTISARLELKVGVHRGHTIAVTLNDRVDYFGQTVNIAARTQQLAVAGEIYVTSDVYETPGVSALLDDYEVSNTTGAMAGVAEEIPLLRILATSKTSEDGE